MTAESKKAFPVFLLLTASLLLTNIHFQSIYILSVAILGVLYIHKISVINSYKFIISLILLLLSLYISIYIYFFGFAETYLSDFSRLHILLILLLAFAAGSAIGTNLAISIPLFSRILLVAMILVAILQFVLNTHFLGVVRTKIFLTQYQYNRNHLDDLYLFQVFVSFQFLMFLAFFERLRWHDLIAGGFLIVIYFAMFLESGSLGGFVGCVVALFVCSVCIIAATKNVRVASGLLLIAVLVSIAVFTGVVGTSIQDRISRTFAQWNAFSLQEVLTYDREFLGKCKSGVPTDKPALPADTAKAPIVVYGISVLRNGEVVDRAELRSLRPKARGDESVLRADPTIGARLVLWRDALRIWLHSPFWGHGEYNPDKLIDAYDNINSCNLRFFAHVHNYYLDLLIRGGIIFLLCYLFVGFLAYRLILRNFGAHKKWVMMSPALFFITYLVIENLFDMTFIWRAAMEVNLVNFAIMLGLAASVHDRSRDKMIMDRLEQSIRNALQKKGVSRLDSRTGVYKSAIQSLEKLSTAEQNRLRPQLIEVIKKIETEYSVGEEDRATQEQAAGSTALAGHEGDGAVEAEDFEVDAVIPVKKRGSRTGLAILSVLLVAIAGLGVFSYYLGWLEPVTKAPVEKAETADPETEIGYTTEALFDIRLPQDLDQLAENVVGRSKSENPFGKFVSGSKFLANQDIAFFSKKLMPVDTSNIYMMSITMTVEEVRSKWPRIQAGFATFDKDKKVQRSPPGAHRYFVHRGVLSQLVKSAKSGDEIRLSGLITDEGNKSYDTMRPGTRFVRPLVFFRVDEDTSVIAVNSLKVLEVN